MNHFFRHFLTVSRHRRLVRRLCRRAGIPWQGLIHDLSKYSRTEFREGARYSTGAHSPNVDARAENGYSLAWMHHKGRNRHHFEYWTDYACDGGGLQPVRMPPRYLAEMLCDRVAASKTYLGASYRDDSPLRYYEGRRDHLLMHAETAQMLEKLLHMLADEGEDATFRFLRAYVKGSKN